ncbi:hypothetical protein M8818_000775 [Zalaria obscura]|uniref:Uncharacterized protein n=1 Tax=Zalaria obscura TaxID=2024903 RepID=A0ACC3SM84_9PEZI
MKLVPLLECSWKLTRMRCVAKTWRARTSSPPMPPPQPRKPGGHHLEPEAHQSPYHLSTTSRTPDLPRAIPIYRLRVYFQPTLSFSSQPSTSGNHGASPILQQPIDVPQVGLAREASDLLVYSRRLLRPSDGFHCTSYQSQTRRRAPPTDSSHIPNGKEVHWLTDVPTVPKGPRVIPEGFDD